MLTHPCRKCGKPVDVTDLMAMEVDVRQKWRQEHAPETCGRSQIEADHPLLEACHEECDEPSPNHGPLRWVSFKRCDVRGCCRSLLPSEGPAA